VVPLIIGSLLKVIDGVAQAGGSAFSARVVSEYVERTGQRREKPSRDRCPGATRQTPTVQMVAIQFRKRRRGPRRRRHLLSATLQ